jgi:hypothetical protein
MRVDAKLCADHLKVVGMKGRIQEAVFGEDFSVEMVDGNSEVIVKGRSSKVKFTESFGVMDLGDFIKLVDSFNGEVNMEVKDGKIVIGSSVGVVQYQGADPSTITTTLKNFDDMCAQYFEETAVVATVANAFPGNFARFQRLISPDVVEFKMKDGKLAADLISMKGHSAELFVGETTELNDKDFTFKISASALQDVLAGFVTTQSHVITMAVGKALKVTLDEDYTFLISPSAA